MNNLLDNKYLVYGRIGSFWAEKLKGKSLQFAKALTALPRITNAADELIEAMRNLSNETHALKSNIVVAFTPKQISVLGPDLQKRLLTVYKDTEFKSFLNRNFPQNSFLQTNAAESLRDKAEYVILQNKDDSYTTLNTATDSELDPDVNQLTPQEVLLTRYLVPFPEELTALKIKTIDRVLLAGLDFEQGRGVLIFKEQPAALFPDFKINVASALKELKHLLNYTTAIENVEGDVSKVAEYYRYSQSTKNFELALATACNFKILKKDSILLRKSGHYFKRVYEFDTETVVVDYPHKVLEVGKYYPADTVIGNPVTVFGAAEAGDTDWWKRVQWVQPVQLAYEPEISLQQLGKFPPLKLSPREVEVRRVGDQIKIYLDPVDANVSNATLEGYRQTYWDICAKGELASELYLKDLEEFSDLDPGDSGTVNPLELYFKYILNEKTWLIKTAGFNLWDIETQNRLNQFVAREKPFGAVLLTQDETLDSVMTDADGLLFYLIKSSMYSPLIT